MRSDEERVPSLDAEACARLLDDLILMLAPHDAQSIADANQLTALKSALPGMGKDSERLDWLNADTERLEEVFGATVRNEQNGDVRAIIDAKRATGG